MGFRFCPWCGEALSEKTPQKCPSCSGPVPGEMKSPVAAAILSAFYPGLGQVYNGDSLKRSLAIFFGFAAGTFLLLIPGLLIWIFAIYDAYNRAERINLRQLPYRDLRTRDVVLVIAVPALVLVILLGVLLALSVVFWGSIVEMLLPPGIY